MKVCGFLTVIAAVLCGAAGCSDNGAASNTPNYASPPPQDSGMSAGKAPPGKGAMTGGTTGARIPAAKK